MSKTELLDLIAKYYIIESQLGYKQNVSLEQNRIQKLEKLFSRAETRALACLGSRRRLLGPSFQPVSAAGRLPGALCILGRFLGRFLGLEQADLFSCTLGSCRSRAFCCCHLFAWRPWAQLPAAIRPTAGAGFLLAAAALG